MTQNIKRIDNAKATFEDVKAWKKRRNKRRTKNATCIFLATLFIIFMVQLLMDKKKYYACDTGHICYPEGSVRSGCTREFNTMHDCKIFIKK